MKHLKLFKTQAEFDTATLELPNVSYIVEKDIVYYHPYVIDFSSQYLTFEAIEDSTFKLTRNACQYSLDEGETWISLSKKTNTPTVSTGNKIMFKATNPTISNSYGIGTFSSTGKFNVEGNIMSLLYGDDFAGKNDLTDKDYIFCKLFQECTNVVESHNLILPATKLDRYCYYYMFNDCTSLTTAPELLPATTLANNCYSYMFRNCTSLTTTPDLPATVLAHGCYSYMFYSCDNLTSAPVLPAITLASDCYKGMFLDCTGLTTAPELPATTLETNCYRSMFQGCSKLNNIIMLATYMGKTDCLTDWVDGVASTGTFTKHPNMTTLPTGTRGIPEGWTVEDYQ